jgi:hypothetical protein
MSVTNTCPGWSAIASGKCAAIIAVWGVTPHVQKTGMLVIVDRHGITEFRAVNVDDAERSGISDMNWCAMHAGKSARALSRANGVRAADRPL